MTQFKVWAPEKSFVEVIVEGETIRMDSERRGWWSATTPNWGPGSDYFFRIEGGEPYPDPRSFFQPQGVHGPSRVVDHGSFAWSDDDFQARPLSAALLYELHIGTFTATGTFESTTEKLGHLADLGVTHLELMPVAEFSGGRGWGYDGVCIYAPHHAYGGPNGLKTLVNACHRRGIAVILDVVYNHLGPAGNYLPQFGPYFTDRHTTPWGSAFNFDGPFSDEVRKYFVDNAKMWLRDYHFDGLRLDAIHAIVDTSAYPFLEQLSAEVKQLEAHLGRHFVLIAESDLSDPRVIQSRDHNGYGFHAQWNDDFHHALHRAVTGEGHGYYRDFSGLPDLARSFREAFLYCGDYSDFRSRSHGRRVCDLEASSFVVCAQNHDQIGNRARGERLSQIVDIERAKVAAALAILSPYVPMLFQGEEWAASTPFQYFVDFSDDPELAAAVSAGRRSEFGEFNWDAEFPDPQAKTTFQQSKLNWDELVDVPHRHMLAWYKALVALRRRFPVFVDGQLHTIRSSFDADVGWLIVQRGDNLIVANMSENACRVPLESGTGGELLLASAAGVQISQHWILLPPCSLAVMCHPGCLDEWHEAQTKNTSSRFTRVMAGQDLLEIVEQGE